MELELKVGRCYSAKKPRRVPLSFVEQVMNDRCILWISPLGDQLQYDSPTVGNGRHYPRIDVEAFRRWAKEDITDQMPKDMSWRPAS